MFGKYNPKKGNLHLTINYVLEYILLYPYKATKNQTTLQFNPADCLQFPRFNEFSFY